MAPRERATIFGSIERRGISVASATGFDDGEFDPGSERTLAARLKHASRANATSVAEAADG